jgi:hypothetical protein
MAFFAGRGRWIGSDRVIVHRMLLDAWDGLLAWHVCGQGSPAAGALQHSLGEQGCEFAVGADVSAVEGSTRNRSELE